MKRLLLAFSLLLTLPLFALDATTDANATRNDRARRPLVIDDVIRMSQSGVSDDAIIAYVKKYRDRFDVNADDVIAMNDAHVSKDVVRAVVDESAVRRDDRGRDREPARYYGGVYVDPWFYPGYYGYYDPFWYGWGPRFSVGVRFGGGRYGHYRGRR